MKKKNMIIVGGDFGDKPRGSSIINQMVELADITMGCDYHNGGSIDELINIDLSPYQLIIWMPNISNEEAKHYPKKPIGSTLICSKVMREDRDETDAVSRIFKMNGNGVITINTNTKPFKFKLIDALGNTWGVTDNINALLNFCYNLHDLYSGSIRQKSIQVSDINTDIKWFTENTNGKDMERFMLINRKVAEKSMAMGGRYFGNCSTRCESMFPSTRLNSEKILVSPRNVDKGSILLQNMILVDLDTECIKYNGSHKPSVDTPVHVQLYKKFRKINFMIHGHYYVYGAPFTSKYYPCGDLREFNELIDIIDKDYNSYCLGVINLKNHGFLLYSSTIEEMEQLAMTSMFIKRVVGGENV